jgi:hypothetical protein
MREYLFPLVRILEVMCSLPHQGRAGNAPARQVAGEGTERCGRAGADVDMLKRDTVYSPHSGTASSNGRALRLELWLQDNPLDMFILSRPKVVSKGSGQAIDSKSQVFIVFPIQESRLHNK